MWSWHSLPQFQSLLSCGSHLCRVDLSQSCSCHMLDMTCLQSISIMSERQVHFKPICKEKGHLSWSRALVSWIIMDHHGPWPMWRVLDAIAWARPSRQFSATSRKAREAEPGSTLNLGRSDVEATWGQCQSTVGSFFLFSACKGHIHFLNMYTYVHTQHGCVCFCTTTAVTLARSTLDKPDSLQTGVVGRLS